MPALSSQEELTMVKAVQLLQVAHTSQHASALVTPGTICIGEPLTATSDRGVQVGAVVSVAPALPTEPLPSARWRVKEEL